MSPGLGIRHYAPRARVMLVESIAELNAVLKREAREHRVGVLLPGGWAAPDSSVVVLRWGSWSEPELLARELYIQMRALDDLGVEVIVCPLPPAEGIGLAIRDRLLKTSE